jgi:hypothetical protein
MLHGCCSCLDLSTNNINAQPHEKLNQVKSRLEENWEYVGYDLSYQDFKTQVNAYLTNKWHFLKVLIEANAPQPVDCNEEHWENMKHFIAFEAKQDKATKNHAKWALVHTPSHSSSGGELGVLGRLVRQLAKISTFLAFSIVFYGICRILLLLSKHDFLCFFPCIDTIGGHCIKPWCKFLP